MKMNESVNWQNNVDFSDYKDTQNHNIQEQSLVVFLKKRSILNRSTSSNNQILFNRICIV